MHVSARVGCPGLVSNVSAAGTSRARFRTSRPQDVSSPFLNVSTAQDVLPPTRDVSAIGGTSYLSQFPPPQIWSEFSHKSRAHAPAPHMEAQEHARQRVPTLCSLAFAGRWAPER